MPPKPRYNPEAARAKRKAQRDALGRFIDIMKAEGRWEELDRQIRADVEEFLHSPNLKIWRYRQTSRSMAHLFAELSDGTKRPLCGLPIDERAVAMVVTTTRRGDCARCNHAAEAIFERRAAPPTSQ